MFKTLLARARQGYRTAGYPAEAPSLPPLFRGLASLDAEKCVSGCSICASNCPTGAIRLTDVGPRLDLGRCIFCGDCAQACTTGAIRF